MERKAQRSAILSDCGTYRYSLTRVWNTTLPPALFVGLNPSTADAEQDDPTIRRCVRFAREWGYGGLLMGNLFAFRATNPKDLPGIGDGPPYVSPVGEFGTWRNGVREAINDTHLEEMAGVAGITIAAWGSSRLPSGWEHRAEQVRNLLFPMHTLGLTKHGHPRHPLYIKADTQPIPLPRHEHKWGPWLMGEQSLEFRYCETCNAKEWD